jgi:predicted amidophosphoribosyltransferase
LTGAPRALSHRLPTVGGVRPPPLLPVPPGLATCRAVVAYDAGARRALVGLKNRGERSRVSHWADELAALAPVDEGLVVTWAPTSDRRRRGRGFDQAELLARAVARRRRLPVAGLLRRLPGAAQAGRTANERQRSPRFVARGHCSVPVLLIDDVCTTGATLRAAAAALLGAGAPRVHGLVVARAARPGAQ